jgi:hypothetical protein
VLSMMTYINISYTYRVSMTDNIVFFCFVRLCSPLFASVRPFLPPHQMSTKQQNVTHNVSPAVAAVDDTKDNSNETDAQLTVSEYYSLSRTLA